MSTSLYERAVNAIRTVSVERQAHLDAKAKVELDLLDLAVRMACVDGLDEDSPAYAVGALLANTIKVGDKRGYPSLSFPKEVGAVIIAANRAGICPRKPTSASIMVGKHAIHYDGSGVERIGVDNEAALEAWSAADSFRNCQKWEWL